VYDRGDYPGALRIVMLQIDKLLYREIAFVNEQIRALVVLPH
jgi:hypothetical protein